MTDTSRQPGVAFLGKVRIATIGHKKAIDKAKGITKDVKGRLHIGLTGTSEPLTPEMKKAHAEKMFNHPVESGEAHTKNLFSFLTHLNKHHDDIHLVAGSDRAPEYKKVLDQWNGRADKNGHVAFHFKSYKVHEVEGEREDVDKHPTQMTQDELERSVSATKLEHLAKSDDYKGFKAYHPGMDEKHVRGVFDQIRQGTSSKKKTVKQLREEIDHQKFGPMLDSFVSFASDKLGIKSLPKMELSKDEMSSSFGGYSPATNSIVVVSKNRHPMDIFRTVAHELVHHKQNEDGRIKDVAKEGSTGSDIENEANSEAGKIMRWFAKSNPNMFKSGFVVESTQLDEGINDPAKLKAVFLAGGPGSGKDFIMNRVLMGHGMSEINSDNALEYLMKKRGLDLKMPDSERAERDEARGKAKKMTKEKERLALAGRRGLIVNGTADDPDKIARIKSELEKQGYETKMLFVNTSNEVSRQRNIQRGMSGGRKVPDGTDTQGRPDGSLDIRNDKWHDAQEAKDKLKKLFGDEHFVHVDNSDDYRLLDDKRRAEVDAQHLQIFKHYKDFTSRPADTAGAKEWMDQEKAKRGITNVQPTRATMPQRKPVPSVQQKNVVPIKPLKQMPAVSAGEGDKPASASELDQAKRLGLEYYGFGRYGRNIQGKHTVTHQSKNGALSMIIKRRARSKMVSEDKDPCWKGYEMIGMKKKGGKQVPNCVPVSEEGGAGDWGTNKLRKRYEKDTPGSVKKIKLKKKKMKEGVDVPINADGIGPTASVARSPNGLGMGYSIPMSEDVQKWMNNDKVQARFVEKYGDQAQEQLLEAAQKLNGIFTSTPKSFTQLRESWDAVAGRDMGSVANASNKDEVDENITLSQYKKKIDRRSTFEKKSFNEAKSSFASAFNAARERGDEKFTWGKGTYGTMKKGETADSHKAYLSSKKAPAEKSVDAKAEPTKAEPAKVELTKKEPAPVSTPTDKSKDTTPGDAQPKQDRKVNPLAFDSDRLNTDNPENKPQGGDMLSGNSRTPSPGTDLSQQTRTGKFASGTGRSGSGTPKSVDESEAWTRKEGQNPEGGLNKKGVASYRAANPGSKLQTAVTTEPSKLKPGSKKAKRRLSFCRRMKGMKSKLTSAETARDPDSRINKSLRKWNCEE